MFKKVDPKVSFPKMEEEILRFWDAEKIFEKSVENRNGKPLYSFYDGPPFATGTPHYGHIVASTIKDTVPRYWTMKGHQVPRRWGWDTHGLPIENIAEKELGITHKKEILELGVAKFNEICRSKVLEYVDEWKKVIHRFGRWADMDNAYSTMDLSYMESVWWAFKELWDKGLIYESYRSMHICPRCETTLSQSEVAEGYKDVKDLAVTVKFKLNAGQKIGDFVTDESTFVLAWTTTPWTLPGNVALAVHEDIEYVVVRTINVQKMANTGTKVYENLIIAKDIFEEIEEADLRDPLRIAFNVCSADSLKEGETFTEGAKVVETFKGSELVRKSYEPLFSFLKEIIDSNKTPKSLKKQDSNESVAPQFAIKPDERFEEKSKEIDKDSREFWKFYDDEDATAYKIYHADFVTTEMGTGIAHEAPAFGEEDMELGKKENLPFVQHVKMDGTIEDEVTGFGGKSLSLKAKGKQDEVREVDLDVKKYLDEKGLLFSSEKYLHSYPHCWRCDTPLLNYATTSWFVKVTEVKERALELAKGIHWSPEHIKEGRFGKWLEGARDWSISRQRFWASVMPIWKCDKCTHLEVFGSVAELEKASGEKVTDLHKHVVDEISYKCEKCDGGTMKRIPDVLDTWFDSGSMPYAQNHYPFENKEKFEKSFPAQFIAEGIDQTRAWFYYLHVMGTSLKGSNAFQNVIVNGVVLAEDGKKMSKRLKNYPDPMEIINKYGSDALRLYLLSSPIVAAENLNFSERSLGDMSRNVFRMLWNSYSFFVTYASIDKWEPKKDAEPSKNLLDRWILSELQTLIKGVDASMEKYELLQATRQFMPFIDNLSNWYIRRSRKRFWKSEDDIDKEQAYQTLYDVLVTLSKLMAPFTPFLTEEMYKNLTDRLSVHLEDFPASNAELIDVNLNKEMQITRELVTLGLKLRADAKIKVRQPLGELRIKNQELSEEMREILKEELNVKNVVSEASLESELELNTEITPELKLEGEAREIIRAVQEGRKKAGFNVEDRITLGYMGKEEVFKAFGELIAREILATSLENRELSDAEYFETIKIEGEDLTFMAKRS